MFKSLSAIEKEFDYTEVDSVNPPFVKWIAFGFVAIIITLAIIF